MSPPKTRRPPFTTKPPVIVWTRLLIVCTYEGSRGSYTIESPLRSLQHAALLSRALSVSVSVFAGSVPMAKPRTLAARTGVESELTVWSWPSRTSGPRVSSVLSAYQVTTAFSDRAPATPQKSVE